MNEEKLKNMLVDMLEAQIKYIGVVATLEKNIVDLKTQHSAEIDTWRIKAAEATRQGHYGMGT